MKGSGSPQSRIEGDVIGAISGGFGADITPALAFGAGIRTAPGLFTGKLIKRCVQAARREFRCGICFLAAFPPIAILTVKNILGRRLRLTNLRGLLLG